MKIERRKKKKNKKVRKKERKKERKERKERKEKEIITVLLLLLYKLNNNIIRQYKYYLFINLLSIQTKKIKKNIAANSTTKNKEEILQ